MDRDFVERRDDGFYLVGNRYKYARRRWGSNEVGHIMFWGIDVKF